MCGKEIEENVDFCPFCGADLKSTTEMEEAVEIKPKRKVIWRFLVIIFLLAVVFGLAWYFTIRCQASGCFNAASNGKYCSEHGCSYIYADCKNLRLTGYKYCSEHVCPVPSCKNCKLGGKNYCSDHDFDQFADEFCNTNDEGEEDGLYRNMIYGKEGALFENPIMQIASDGSWIKIDSNPDDIDSDTSNFSYLIVLAASKVIMQSFNDSLLEKLGFSDSVGEEQYETNSLMGVQTAESDIAKASWSYSSDEGLEITYTFKSK